MTNAFSFLGLLVFLMFVTVVVIGGVMGFLRLVIDARIPATDEANQRLSLLIEKLSSDELERLAWKERINARVSALEDLK